MNTDIAVEAAKSAPPVAVATAAFAGDWSLNNLIGAATLLYILLQAGYLVWKWRRDIKREREMHRTQRAALRTSPPPTFPHPEAGA